MGKNSRRIEFLIKITILYQIADRIGISFLCTCFHRSAEEQNKRYQQGRTLEGDIVTNQDGYRIRSKHQNWEAWDILIIKNGEPVWPRSRDYETLGEIWKRILKGIWGGDWRSPEDIYHFQLGE